MNGMLLPTWRNFVRNIHRYRVLLMALILITASLTLVFAVVLGMRESLYEKASRYFTGNLVVMGYTGNGKSNIYEPALILESIYKLESEGLPLRTVSCRSTLL